MDVVHTMDTQVGGMTLNRKALCVLFFLMSVALLSSCAPSKAYFDRTAAEKIIWPGPPEKPRIQYLWSLSNLSAGSEGRRGYHARQRPLTADGT